MRGAQLITVLLAMAVLIAATPVSAQSSDAASEPGYATRPEPGDPGAISWTGGEWALMIASATVGELAGGVGAIALYWSLTDACGERNVDRCYAAHRPSTLAIGLALGAPVGATVALGVAGGVLGFEGTALMTLGGAAMGLLVFGSAFGPFVDPEVSVALGSALAVVAIPGFSALLYYISQPNAVRVGDSASLIRLTPETGLSWGLPALGIVPVGADIGISVPLLSGSF